MTIKTWAAMVAVGLAAGTASAQTTASGRSVAGSPSATTGAPRAGTGIPDPQQGETRAAVRTAIATGVPTGGAAQEPAVGAAPAGGLRTANTAAAMNDGLFAAAAAGSGLCEVASSRLALERAASPEVKQFAQRMIDDHTRANQELMALAGQKGLTLPTTLPIPSQAELAALSGVSGEEFDKCYIHQQLAAHIQAVGLFEAEAQRGTDPQLKGWAGKTVPALKEHMMMVKKMHEACEAKEKSANPAH